MTRVDNIESQIKELSRKELAVFREWFAQFDAEAWDRQFESDVKSGKLDSLAARALRDHDAGNGTPVAIVSNKRVLGSMRGLIKEETGWDAPIDDRDAEEFGL
jgi:hypothetical protein